MNRNATPTVIRGTTILPGARVALLFPSHSYQDPPVLRWFDVIATDGTSFAHQRKHWASARAGRGPFAYVEEPDRYLISEAEADAAMVKAFGEDAVALAKDEIEKTRQRIIDLHTHSDRVKAHLVKLTFCGVCNPHHPKRVAAICPRCERRACADHAKHVCQAKEKTA